MMLQYPERRSNKNGIITTSSSNDEHDVVTIQQQRRIIIVQLQQQNSHRRRHHPVSNSNLQILLTAIVAIIIIGSLSITHGFIIVPTTRNTLINNFLRILRTEEQRTTGTTVAVTTGMKNYQVQQNRYNPSIMNLYATKKKNTKSSKQQPLVGGIKGFGGGSVTPKAVDSSSSSFELDRSNTVRNFCLYMEQQQQQNSAVAKNWQRTGLAYFPLSAFIAESTSDDKNKAVSNDDDIKLRGVVAIQDIPKGQEIINIPYEIAINLGEEGDDPTIPAIQFLQHYCTVMNSDAPNNKNPTIRSYYELLPNLYCVNPDCYGSTDFFSNEALEEIQYLPVIQETKLRKQRIEQRYQEWITYYNENNALPLMWNSTTSIQYEHFQWAVWIITSRVLTVQGAVDSNKYYRLLIPYLDMCNHDRDSPHILTGRATDGASLKIVAGTTVKAGTQINIPYGAGTAGNDRFIQDYGFLDTNVAAYQSIANELLGKTPVRGGSSQRKLSLSLVEREEALQALQQTTVEYDQSLLDGGSITDPQIRSAIQFRLGIKQALAKLQ